ncbi:unnamed protein product [Linum tenue]|uniref:Transcription repressor n=1 Tax=Linum tenue TaxID=586396 RepID=A0AAV0IPD1_9ROSI|nr:unnamed protein product [Linum tenue]
MGLKHRFRLSDMIPNAWFYKLKDMSKSIPTTTHHSSNHKKKRPPNSTVAAAATRAPQQPRYSSYLSGKPGRATNNHHHYQHHKLYNSPVNQKASDTQFPDPPRRSSRRRKAVYKPSPKLLSSSSSSSVCSKCRDNNSNNPTLLHSPGYSTSPFESSPDFCGSILTESEDEDDDLASSFARPPRSFDDQVVSAAWSTSCHSCKLSSSTADIIIDVNRHSLERNNINKVGIHELEKLPPIVTKPSRMDHVKAQRSVSDQKKRTKSSPSPRKSTSNKKYSATGIRLKANSPRRLASRKVQGSRKSTAVTSCLSAAAAGNRIGESFAVVKKSVDPERDFMESMVEMIVENGIRGSRELEDLLACYLSLNSTKYHDVIVRAFEQIWFHMS